MEKRISKNHVKVVDFPHNARYIYNHRPHISNKEISPSMVLFQEGDIRRKPFLNYIQPIGCKVTMNVAKENARIKKVGEHAITGWYIGLAEGQPGVRIWNNENNKIYVSTHV